MENTFDLKKFLVENKLTNNSKILSEQEQLEEGWKDWVLGGLLTLSTVGGGAKLYQLNQDHNQDRAKQTEYVQKVLDPILGKMSDQQLVSLGLEIDSHTGKFSLSGNETQEQLDYLFSNYAKDFVHANPSLFGITADGQVELIKK